MMVECDACKLIDLMNAMEFGFKQCEAGNNLDTARLRFKDIMEDKNG